MKNMWKGLVIGGLTGAAAGLALDLGERGAQGVAQLGGAVAERAPGVVDHLRHSAGAAADMAADRASDLPAGARSAAAAAHDAVTDLLSGSVPVAADAVRASKEGALDAFDRTHTG